MMQAAIRRMGNSAGILLPKPVLAHLQVQAGDMLDLNLENGRVILSVLKPHPRAGWAEAAKELAEAGDDEAAWPDFANADDATLEW